MNVIKQNLTKEDINFDTAGTGAKVDIFNSDGTTREASKLNASHIPILEAIRADLDGAVDINGALVKILSLIESSGGDASQTEKGMIEIASSAEVQAGISGTHAVTPLTLKLLTATLTRAGLIELATEAEALAGTDANRAISPVVLNSVLDDALNNIAAMNIEYGMFLSNNVTDALNDIDISIGQRFDSTRAYNMKLSSVLTKKIDEPWEVGTNKGGFPTGIALTADTWYNVFSIYNPTTGITGAGYDSDINAANLLSDADGYTKYELIESFLTDGSSNIIPFIHTIGKMKFATPILNFSGAASAARVLKTILTPPGREVEALLNIMYAGGGVGTLLLYIAHPDSVDIAPSLTIAPLVTVAFNGASSTSIGAQIIVDTNKSSQIAVRGSNTETYRTALVSWSSKK